MPNHATCYKMSAYDSLMSKSRSAKKRRRNTDDNKNNDDYGVIIPSSGAGSRFFACPAGCGKHVSERDVNDHLDKCPKLNKNDSSCNNESGSIGEELNNPKPPHSEIIIDNDDKALPQSTSKHKAKHTSVDNNAFQHMMKRSAQVYSNNNDSIKQRFHLHNTQGMISWSCDDIELNNGGAAGDNAIDDNNVQRDVNNIQWSTTIVLKKVKTITIDKQREQLKPLQNTMQERQIELTVSSSIPPFNSSSQQSLTKSSTTTTTCNHTTTNPQQPPPRLVQRHSRLSISHLKSCLQKSIRRRKPLPAVRVAMELADKSWTDLIRRLPIIILEDSTLHPDFSLLVWLMIADSKGYIPSRELIVRVMQIVFEMAACPLKDSVEHSEDASLTKSITDKGSDNIDNNPTNSFSLCSSSSDLFPTQQYQDNSRGKECEATIRSMLLRAQYGGMKCDVDMLHAFAKLWLQRFNDKSHPVPNSILGTKSATDSTPNTNDLKWMDVPRIIHTKAREQSEKLVTMNIFNPTGIVVALNTNDVCPAGIDFHCSPVVDHLLSRPTLYECLCERLKPLASSTKSETMYRDWIAGKVKQCIWNYSSGVNRRRPMMGSTHKSDCDNILKGIWDYILSSPFDDYVKKFVKDRLN
ncbi:hypothetical protein ACHAWC_011205 [Mediolabrus comicus]